MSTFIELKEQAEQDIRAHIPRPSSDSAEHFVADTTNHFEPRQETDADLRALIDSASARTLVIIARDLAEGHGPDQLHASVQLEGIAYEPRRQLSDALDFARKGLQPAEERGRRRM